MYTVASQQIQGVLPELNSDTMWRFLAKIHKRVVGKFQEASSGTGESAASFQSGIPLLAEDPQSRRLCEKRPNHALSAEIRDRIRASFPKKELLHFVHVGWLSGEVFEELHLDGRGAQLRQSPISAWP